MRTIIMSMAVLLLIGCSSDTTQKNGASSADTKPASAKSEPVAAAEVKDTQKTNAQEPKAVMTQEVQAAAAEVKQEAVQEVKAQTAAVVVDGKTLFQACAACHGPDASKSALGKSRIIKGWDAKKVEDALHGYKNGTYGGVMKGVMVGQVSRLNDEQIEALAKYISSL